MVVFTPECSLAAITASIAVQSQNTSASLNLVSQGTGTVQVNGLPIMSNPMTTTGDLVVGGAGGAPTWLAAVAGGQALIPQGVGVAPIWGTAAVTFPLTSAGDMGFQPDGVASNALTLQNGLNAVTGINILGQSAGGGVFLSVTSSSAAEDLIINSKGASFIALYPLSDTGSVTLGGQQSGLTAGQAGLTVTGAAAGVNGVTITQAATGAKVNMQSTGSDGNIGFVVSAKGTGHLFLQSGGVAECGTGRRHQPQRRAGADQRHGHRLGSERVHLHPGGHHQRAGDGGDGNDTNVKLTIDAKNTGTILIATNSTGAIVLGQITTISKGLRGRRSPRARSSTQLSPGRPPPPRC